MICDEKCKCVRRSLERAEARVRKSYSEYGYLAQYSIGAASVARATRMGPAGWGSIVRGALGSTASEGFRDACLDAFGGKTRWSTTRG